MTGKDALLIVPSFVDEPNTTNVPMLSYGVHYFGKS